MVKGSKLGRGYECPVQSSQRIREVTYTASCRKGFTLYIVINTVGDEIVMIGNMLSVNKGWAW